jgi:lysophospholipase L1-like esterase
MVASGGSSGGGAGSGGTSGKGGALGSGGSNASGGAIASGGTTGSGGKAGTGGAPGLGGDTQQGGTTGGGGTAVSSGAVGSGGTADTGGATTPIGTGGSNAGGTGAGGVAGRDAGAGGAAGGTIGTGGTIGHDAGPGTGGNTSAYQPCPSSGGPCKVLPLGDSITFGVGDEGNAGYRGPLFAAAVAAGKKLTFTGSLSNGPGTVSGQTFPKNNEGHSGWGISRVTPYSNNNAGIATRIPSPAFDSGSGGLPNIILLHIGTNDQGSFSASQMTSDLGGLIDKMIANAPDALLVVAQIIPLGYGTNDVIKTYNQSIPGLVQTRASAGKHIVLVDMYTGFTASSMLGSDSIHPNAAGYKFMADHWYAAIGSHLP